VNQAWVKFLCFNKTVAEKYHKEYINYQIQYVETKYFIQNKASKGSIGQASPGAFGRFLKYNNTKVTLYENNLLVLEGEHVMFIIRVQLSPLIPQKCNKFEVIEICDKLYGNDFCLLDQNSGLFSLQYKDKLCLATIDISPLTMDSFAKVGKIGNPHDDQPLSPSFTAQTPGGQDDGNPDKMAVEKSKKDVDELGRFASTSSMKSSFVVVSEVMTSFSYINEMCKMSDKSIWDHILAFQTFGTFNGVAMFQNSVKVSKLNGQILEGLSRVHTLYFKGNNPNGYYKYMLLSYNDYKNAAKNPKLIFSDPESPKGEIAQAPSGAFDLNLGEKTLMLKSKQMLWGGPRIIIQITVSSIVLISETDLKSKLWVEKLDFEITDS
jgi:hypothetical protein